MKLFEGVAGSYVADGWSPSLISVIQSYCDKYQVTAEHLGWGFLVQSQILLYKSMETQDIRDAFRECFETGFTRRPTVAFCDGSGTKDKPCGIGVVIYVAGSQPQLIAENIGVGTNNVAELRAIWRALQAFPDVGRKMMVRTDSEYSIGSLTLDWHPTANVELIRSIREDLSLRNGNIRFDHVDGHSGVEGNEIADKLANIGRKIVTKVSL